jgi:adenylate cyclase
MASTAGSRATIQPATAHPGTGTALKILAAVAALGAAVGEGGEAALRRQLLVAAPASCMVAGILGSATYFGAGASVAAAAPLAYAVLSLVSTLVLAVTRHQPLSACADPAASCFMSVALGGFHASSAIIVWSLLSLLDTLMSAGLRTPVLLFDGFGEI